MKRAAGIQGCVNFGMRRVAGIDFRMVSALPLLVTMDERRRDGVKDLVKVLARVLRQESQDEIPVLLKQSVLSPVPPVRLRVGEMLRAIQLDDHTGFGA